VFERFRCVCGAGGGGRVGGTVGQFGGWERHMWSWYVEVLCRR
jgi:hypothetical protein